MADRVFARAPQFITSLPAKPMAQNFFTCTLALPELMISEKLDGTNGVVLSSAGLSDTVRAALDGPQALASSSRKDWLHRALRTALFPHPALAFLVRNDLLQSDRTIASCYVGAGVCPQADIWLITSLRNERLPAAIADLASLLANAASSPEIFAATLLTDDAEEVRRGFCNSIDSTREESFFDDGDTPTYFFSFLKGLQSVLRDAQTRKLDVLHLRYF